MADGDITHLAYQAGPSSSSSFVNHDGSLSPLPIRKHIASGHPLANHSYTVLIMVMGAGFFGIFMAFNTAQSLSTLMAQSLANISLIVLYTVFAFACIFAPKVVTAMGPRVSMVVGGIPYIFMVLSYLRPGYFTSVPSHLAVGLGAPLIWTGSAVYISRCAAHESLYSGKPMAATASYFNGLFFSLFNFNGCLGLLFASIAMIYLGESANTAIFITLAAVCAVGIAGLAILPTVDYDDLPDDIPRVVDDDVLGEYDHYAAAYPVLDTATAVDIAINPDIDDEDIYRRDDDRRPTRPAKTPRHGPLKKILRGGKGTNNNNDGDDDDDDDDDDENVIPEAMYQKHSALFLKQQQQQQEIDEELRRIRQAPGMDVHRNVSFMLPASHVDSLAGEDSSPSRSSGGSAAGPQDGTSPHHTPFTLASIPCDTDDDEDLAVVAHGFDDDDNDTASHNRDDRSDTSSTAPRHAPNMGAGAGGPHRNRNRHHRNRLNSITDGRSLRSYRSRASYASRGSTYSRISRSSYRSHLSRASRNSLALTRTASTYSRKSVAIPVETVEAEDVSLVETLSLMVRDPRMTLVCPIIIYNGLSLGFMFGDFGHDIIAVSIGMNMVGFVMANYYLFNAIFTFIAGKLASTRRCERLVFVYPFLFHFVVFGIITLVPVSKNFLQPEDSSGSEEQIGTPVWGDYALCFVMSLLFAIGDSVIQAQFQALLQTFFQDSPRDSDSAMAGIVFLQSLGLSIQFVFGLFIKDTTIKGSILLATNLISLVCSLILISQFMTSSASGMPDGSDDDHGVDMFEDNVGRAARDRYEQLVFDGGGANGGHAGGDDGSLFLEYQQLAQNTYDTYRGAMQYVNQHNNDHYTSGSPRGYAAAAAGDASLHVSPNSSTTVGGANKLLIATKHHNYQSHGSTPPASASPLHKDSMSPQHRQHQRHDHQPVTREIQIVIDEEDAAGVDDDENGDDDIRVYQNNTPHHRGYAAAAAAPSPPLPPAKHNIVGRRRVESIALDTSSGLSSSAVMAMGTTTAGTTTVSSSATSRGQAPAAAGTPDGTSAGATPSNYSLKGTSRRSGGSGGLSFLLGTSTGSNMASTSLNTEPYVSETELFSLDDQQHHHQHGTSFDPQP